MSIWWKSILGVLTLAAIVLAGPRLYTQLRFSHKIQPVDEALARPVAIVFGAGLRADGLPTAVLYDRVATAAELFRLGKVDVLLLSGDNRSANYDEPAAMRRTALELGVPDSAILVDAAGVRTYDTCYRARHVYGVETATLVTQAFHLPRALYLCQGLGIDAGGVAADRRAYLQRALVYWHFRETLATVAAAWDLFVARPEPEVLP